jgi:hypothetical protein
LTKLDEYTERLSRGKFGALAGEGARRWPGQTGIIARPLVARDDGVFPRDSRGGG